MIQKRFALAVLSIAFSAISAQAKNEDLLPLRKLLVEQQRALSRMPAPRSNRQCANRYEKIWKDGTLNIDWFVGYLDSGARDVVSDRLMRKEAARNLIQPCINGLSGACGFKLTNGTNLDSEVIQVSKRDSHNRRVLIRIWHSNLRDYNHHNTVGIGIARVTKPAQRARTQNVWRAFEKSLRSSEVVIYSGHSRHGSGPGFGPYNLGEMILGELFKPSWQRTLSALDRGEPELLVMESCISSDHYLKSLNRNSPRMAVGSTSEDVLFGAGFQMIFSLVDSLVVGRCENDINRAFNATASSEAGGMKVTGFE